MRLFAFLGALALACTLGTTAFAQSVDVSTSSTTTTAIPQVEAWQEIYLINPPDELPGLRSHIYQDPNDNGKQGVTLSTVSESGAEKIFVRAWNADFMAGRNVVTVMIALELDSGMWVVGDPGEQMLPRPNYDGAGNMVSVTISFDGKHKSAGSRTVVLLPPPPPAE